MPFFVEVILPLSLSKTFTYQVSESEFDYIKIGMRVAVPFGKSKIYTALVIELHNHQPTLYDAKEIHQILDETPIVSEIQIAHWQWIASYYMCAIGDVYRGAMPSGLLLESETIISQKNDVFLDESQLSDEEYLIYEALQQQSSLKVADIMAILNKKNCFPIIQKLLDKNVIALDEEMIETYKPKLVKYVRLQPKYESNESLSQLLELLKAATKQKELVLQYFQLKAIDKNPILAKKLIDSAHSTPAVLKALVDKNVFETYYIQEDRVNFSDNSKPKKLELSSAQQLAYEAINNNLKQNLKVISRANILYCILTIFTLFAYRQVNSICDCIFNNFLEIIYIFLFFVQK